MSYYIVLHCRSSWGKQLRRLPESCCTLSGSLSRRKQQVGSVWNSHLWEATHVNQYTKVMHWSYDSGYGITWTMVWHWTGIHSDRCQLKARITPTGMASEWIPWSTRTILLWRRSKQGFWSRCRWSTLPSLSVCWHSHLWRERRSHASPMGVPTRTIGWSVDWRRHVDVKVSTPSSCRRFPHSGLVWSQTHSWRLEWSWCPYQLQYQANKIQRGWNGCHQWGHWTTSWSPYTAHQSLWSEEGKGQRTSPHRSAWNVLDSWIFRRRCSSRSLRSDPTVRCRCRVWIPWGSKTIIQLWSLRRIRSNRSNCLPPWMNKFYSWRLR